MRKTIAFLSAAMGLTLVSGFGSPRQTEDVRRELCADKSTYTGTLAAVVGMSNGPRRRVEPACAAGDVCGQMGYVTGADESARRVRRADDEAAHEQVKARGAATVTRNEQLPTDPAGNVGREARRTRQTEAPQKLSAQPEALLRMDAPFHDFGDVKRRGGDLVHDFTIRNEGSVPLVLTRVVTSCSCLKAEFSRRPLEPGGEAAIRIVYEPLKSEPGTFHKVIQVYSNSAGGRQVITVQGNSLDTKKK